MVKVSLKEILIEQDYESIAKCVASIKDGGKDVSKGTLIINFREGKDPMGLIEDIWTHEDYRKRGLATRIVLSLVNTAKEWGCYKVNLSCADHNIDFYRRFGFEVYQNNMRVDL